MKLERDRMKAKTEAVEAQMKAMQVSHCSSSRRFASFLVALEEVSLYLYEESYYERSQWLIHAAT